MGGAAATVFYNLRQRHPTLDLPIIDYNLALLFQPMLVLGISIGVSFNVVFAEWMITVLLIIIFIGIYCLNCSLFSTSSSMTSLDLVILTCSYVNKGFPQGC